MACPVMGQTSPLDPPKPLELNAARQRLDELEKQIAERIPKLHKEDDPEGKSIRADLNFRMAARVLLKLGVDAGPDGSLAVLYGYTLADHADEVAALTGKLPGMVQVVQDPAQKLTPEQTQAVNTFAAALDRFNTFSEDKTNAPLSADTRLVDEYMQKLLAPLALAATTMGEPEPMGTWLRPGGDEDAAAPMLTRADLDDMVKRIHSLSVTTQTKTELLSMVDLLSSGYGEPDLRPRIVAFYDLLDQAITVAEAFTGAQWFGPDTLGDFRTQLQTAVQLVKDPRTRDSGVARFESLAQSLHVIDQMNALSRQAAPIDTLREVFLVVHRLRMNNEDRQTADALDHYMQRLMTTMIAYRDLLADDLPLDIRRVSLQMRKEYQTRELTMLAQLRALAANPGDVNLAKWEDPLVQLEASAALVRRVHSIPKWIERLERFKPRPTGGLFRTLRDLALRLTNPDTRQQGEYGLLLLDQQMQMFDEMPVESQLREHDKAVERLTNGANLLLMEQVDRQRGDWASAWASGTDATQTVAHLTSLRRLLAAIDLARGLTDLDAIARRLNRWAGWEVDAAAAAPLMNGLTDRIASAARDAAIGQWANVDTALDQIERDTALPLLVARLYNTLGDGLAKLPPGVSGMLGECMYAPRADSIAAAQRDTLARLCVYIAEAAQARRLNRPERVTSVMDKIAELTRSVMRDWK
ncbi:MAG: hypothetical protein GC162_03525 [Planctomycetes bacterium]|nr:hypothetical protein [Planctomycetota bacterium]